MSDYNALPGYTVNDTMARVRQNETGTAVPVFIVSTGTAGLSLRQYDSFEQFTTHIGPLHSTLSDPVSKGLQAYFNNEGGACYVLGITPAQATDRSALRTALQEVMDNQDITLLAMPEHPELWDAIMPECAASRPDIFCLIDPPRAAQALSTFVSTTQKNIGSVYTWGDRAAAYWPWLMTEYRTAGQAVAIPPSFVVAALIARTDDVAGIWKAPANSELIHILAPDASVGAPSSADAVQINHIISLPGLGPRIWGCRTFMPPTHSHCYYVQVRRLLTYIEHNLTELGRFMIFEPNNAMTWFKYKGVAHDWLRTLWQAGGLAGQTEDEAWHLALGLGETMTARDVDAGVIRIRVQVRPPDIAESLTLELHLTLYETSTSPTRL